MLIRCFKCGKGFDPECESAYCSPYYGHAPVAASGQKLTAALGDKIKKPAKKKETFQSDFKLIWDETNR